jgi:CheY-like chemotaxis protein
MAGSRILLIDDNRDFRDALVTRLRAEHFDVTAVGSGSEGLAAAASQPFDLVLLDMLMPEQDGIATYQALRANEQTRKLPVILLTCAAVEGYWEPMPYETDAPAYILGKPYDPKILLGHIREVLSRPA